MNDGTKTILIISTIVLGIIGGISVVGKYVFKNIDNYTADKESLDIVKAEEEPSFSINRTTWRTELITYPGSSFDMNGRTKVYDKRVSKRHEQYVAMVNEKSCDSIIKSDGKCTFRLSGSYEGDSDLKFEPGSSNKLCGVEDDLSGLDTGAPEYEFEISKVRQYKGALSFYVTVDFGDRLNQTFVRRQKSFCVKDGDKYLGRIQISARIDGK